MSFFKRIPALLVAAVLMCAPVVTALVALQPVSAAAQAPAADAAKPAAAPGAVAKESVENPYGIKAMLEHGDWVSKGTLTILVIMSMGSWYILVVKLFEQRRFQITEQLCRRDVEHSLDDGSFGKRGLNRLNQRSFSSL